MNSSRESELRKHLQESLDQAEWAWIARHADRDALILVHADLNLLEVGIKVALDDVAQIQEWIEQGKLKKPLKAQLDSWQAAPTTKFLSLIVQPYVLAQELRAWA